MNYRDLMEEQSFDEYNDQFWVEDLMLHQRAQLRLEALAEEES